MYRKNTASQFVCFQGVDATTGGIKSGVSWTIRRCIDGTFAAGGGTVTEDGSTGWYKYAMSQADTNGNDISFNFTGSGAVPQTVNVVTTACDPTVATNFGITGIPAVATGNAGALLVDGTGTAAVSNSSGMVLLQATQTGVTIPAVTTVTNRVTANTDQLAGQTVTAAAGVTFPTSVASPTNITAGAITTVANLTNAPTNGDFTSAMKTSLDAATPASVTGAVGSVAGNVVGSVGSISGITFPTNFGVLGITVAGKISEVVLTETLTTYTGNTLQTGDNFALIGPTGSGLTSLAPSATALSSAVWTAARAGYIDNLNVGGSVASHVDTVSLAAQIGALPTAAGNAAAVAAYDIGNGRTVAYFLQGGANKVSFAADGLSFTVYATDDATQLYVGTSTRLSTSVGGLRSIDPT